MSKSAKTPQPKHSATNSSTSAERKPALSIIKDIQPDAGAGQTRCQYSAEEKIRIVLEGLQGEQSVAEICPAPAYRTRRTQHQYLVSVDRPAEAVKSF